jgi:hypothetical protein
MDSDTGSRTPSCRVKDGDVSRYTISDDVGNFLWFKNYQDDYTSENL